MVLKNCSLKGTFGNQNGSSAASQQNLYLEPLFLRVLGAWWKHAALGTKKTDICRLYHKVYLHIYFGKYPNVSVFSWHGFPLQFKPRRSYWVLKSINPIGTLPWEMANHRLEFWDDTWTGQSNFRDLAPTHLDTHPALGVLGLQSGLLPDPLLKTIVKRWQ